jgi:hypothetical protein
LPRFIKVLAPTTSCALVMPQRPPDQDKPATEAATAADCEVETVQARPQRINWERLLERVSSCDVTRVQVSLR